MSEISNGSVDKVEEKKAAIEKHQVSLADFTQEEQEANTSNDAKPKHFSTLALIGLSFAILNTWAASSGSIYIGLSSGGPTSVVYGTILGTLGALAIAASLAEMCHVIPSKGAQYHWCFAFAFDKPWQNSLSYATGWMGTAGWIALTSTAPYLTAQSVIVIVQLYYPTFAPAPWFTFVIYVAITVYGALVNIFGVKLMNTMNTVSLIYSIVGAVTIFVTLLACSSSRGTIRDGQFIFTEFINVTGWPDGVAWIMGLLQTQYSLVGADGAAHVVDEIDKPKKNAPMAMVLSCLIGGITSLIVCISFLAATTDPIPVIEALGGGSLVVIVQGVGNYGGVTVLSVLYLVTQLFTTPALMVTCSRMIQSFSKDGCLPFPRYLGASSPRWEVPVYAVLFNTAWLTIFGLLLFASPLAIVAIQSASVVMLQCSYLPVTFLFLFRGRKWIDGELSITRTFTMGKQWGPIINIVALAYISITTVFFLFPSVYPVTSASLMNYAVVVVVVSALLATVNWFLFVRNHFTAPLGLLTVHSTATTATDSKIS